MLVALPKLPLLNVGLNHIHAQDKYIRLINFFKNTMEEGL
jgi:hypothetical protein